MSSQRLALHARFPEGATDADVATAYDKGAALVGMALHGVERKPHGVTRLYGERGGGQALSSPILSTRPVNS